MRENGIVHVRMIERNWVLKRKRKRLPSGSDLSHGKEGIPQPSESQKSNSSAKRKLKGDLSSEPEPDHKKKGNDGYYYECVICDLGGNLLCCDSCPRTYHLQCLNPPLKRTPPGKWQCPNCCEQKESLKPINNPEIISRRARTKISVDKLRREMRPTGSDRLSLFFQSTIPGKNRSSSKGKRAFPRIIPPIEKKIHSNQMDPSSSPESSHLADGRFTEDALMIPDIDVGKKTSLPHTDGSPNKKSSSQEDAQPSAKGETDQGDTPELKSDVMGNNDSSVSKHRTDKRDKKRKQKINKEDDKKRSKGNKGKHTIISSSKHGSKTLTSQALEISGPSKKRSSFNKRISIKVSRKGDGVPICRKDEKLPKDLPPPSRGLNVGVEVNKMRTSEENTLDELQQVDRILGCRVQNTDVASSPHAQTIALENSPTLSEPGIQSLGPETGSSSCDLLLLRSHDGEIGEHSDCGGNLYVKDDEDGQAGRPPNISDQVDGVKTADDFIGMVKIDKSPIDFNAARSGFQEESTFVAVDVGELNGKVETVEKTDVHNATTEKTPNDTAKDEIGDEAAKESAPMSKDTGLFEFLVKWVGQSNIHNSWVTESRLKVLAKRKLENYKAKYGTAVINLCQEQWKQPQRIVALRTSESGNSEALIKWCGLSYDECTWERLDEPVVDRSRHLIDEFKRFECETLDKDAAGCNLPKTEGDQQNEIAPLTEQPKYLKGGSLFPHQLEALNWLRKCWHKSKNVILADEMGLGKTVSASAFISSLYFEFKARLPCLVLVPLSTMPNWLAEFALWAPHLNVVEYHGSAKARSVIRQHEWYANDPSELQKKSTSFKFNVLLTTYEMVLADASHLRGIQWEVLVVDEGHRLKNSGSKLFSLLNTFSFQHRVLLTGTPLQNNIGEMYNLLNFLQPTSFPSLSAFEENFNELTTAEKVEELKKLVAPHMLRRLKKDAMQNIPPKTERMVPVELSSIQAEYYRAMLTKNYHILRNVGKGVAQQSMLNIVMQLRKVCNHPYLIPGTEPESGSVEFLQEMRIKASAKLTLLHSMLKMLDKEGHRVLIFSQMTKLLDILEDYLNVEFGPKSFERVDGSVSVADRQAAIARFNQDKSRFVFLLSTRSCGLGINLATADTVIIYDSDFNPHADIQAMNRAHRIGQSNRLLVYRLVVRASVEERILQLAKKKLMLDQLFVNKSESQKDVEDILRWGTEELFSDSAVAVKDNNDNSSNKSEVAIETEQKQRRRSGGLGDVYKDRCTDGCTNIVWDESAILRLLDRSNLHSGPSEGSDGDAETDMLGSVKSIEWNDEPTEEQGGTELAPGATGDVGAQNSDKKEDNTISNIEENEWDRLLRVRWEKYQIEEEAALGRGKRLRKAVSYREAFVSIPNEASETCHDEEAEQEQEPEPEPEYTPSGRALKAKYAKLRARQKERLAQRHSGELSRLTGLQLVNEWPPQFAATPAEGEHLKAIKSSEPNEAPRGQPSAIGFAENKINQESGTTKRKNDLTMRLGRLSKHGYRNFHSSNLDLSVRPPGTLPADVFLRNSQFQTTGHGNSPSTSNNLLPVLGLCAPNAGQADTKFRNFRSYLNLPRTNYSHSKMGVGLPELPLQLAPNASTVEELKEPETRGDAHVLPDLSVEAVGHQRKSTIQDGSFTYGPFHPGTPQGANPDPVDSSGGLFSAFQEKTVLPQLILDDKLPYKFPLPSKNVKPSTDLLPSLSLGMKDEKAAKDSFHDLPVMPLLPTFGPQLNENLTHNLQARELPSPMLGLGQMQAASSSSLPEKHKKVLEGIMMRTGSGGNSLLRKKLKVDAWSEEELDALWIGVRRHGRGNWEGMLRDPKLKFSKYRTAEDLLEKWEEEQLKILDGPSFPPWKSMKSELFSGLSDGMMSRALLEGRFSGLGPEHCAPPKFRSHLTDMQLGYGDPTPSLRNTEPSDHYVMRHDVISPIQGWKPDKFVPNFCGDFSIGPSNRGGDSKLPFQIPCLPRSLAASSIHSSNLNHLSSCDLQQKEDDLQSDKYLKLPSLLDKSLHWLRDSNNNAYSGEPSSIYPSNLNKTPSSGHSSKNGENAENVSTTDKLPHWLREAVSVPPKASQPNLPPTVSAIAHSVRLVYGEDKATIPPFTIPAPPPPQPKDPRKSLKRKRRLWKIKRSTPDEFASSRPQGSLLNDAMASSSSIQPAPTFPLLPPSAGGMFGSPWVEPSLSLSSLNENVMIPPPPSSSSSFLFNSRKKGLSMSPSPEVLNLVASCVGPGPSIPSSTFLQNELPAMKSYEPPFEAVGLGGSPDMKGLRGKRKARRGAIFGSWGPLPEERPNRVDSGDSSKTQSDPGEIEQKPETGISSEETVSDERGSEH